MLPSYEVDPVGQLEHDAEPETLLYLPVVHREHGPPFGPDEPVLHVQVWLPDGALELEGQLVHVAEDVAAGVGENFPLGHAVQSSTDVEPSDRKYVPVGHEMHAAAPA